MTTINKTNGALRTCLQIAVALLAQSSATAQVTVGSPDSTVVASFTAGKSLLYSVMYHGKLVITDSHVGLEYRGLPAVGDGMRVVSVQRRAVSASWKPVYGKFSTVHDRFNEAVVHLAGADKVLPTLDLTFRVYDDGVAFRYSVHSNSNSPNDPKHPLSWVLTKEETEFRFPGDARAWTSNKDPAYESEYNERTLSSINNSTLISLPMLVQLYPDVYAAITEADLTDWSGAYLSGDVRQPIFSSGTIRGADTPRKISVSVKGLDAIDLNVGDAGDGFEFDHADWADAYLVASDGTRTALSTLTPTHASQGFGSLKLDRSVDGNPLSISGVPFRTGLGTHSIGSIGFALNGNYDRLEASIGIDSEAKGKGSVQFSIVPASTRLKPGSPVSLHVNLAPRINGDGLVKREGDHSSPWRIIMLGSRPGALVESELVENLSPHCAIPDTSWIRPGKMAWDHWWSGDVKMDTASDERFIQFASEMHFPYQLVDWQWYGDFDNPSADITRTNPKVDMPELLSYAKQHNVRLWVWLHSNDVNRYLQRGDLDSAFATYEKWGLAGVKIDFMNRDDQEMVNWYVTVVQKAAAHHLMVDFHGAFKPTGLRRTWPNLLTREGVLGNEYNKFSHRVTPQHTLTLPFTRMLAGPMDFTPGGFINTTVSAFKQTTPTQVMGTRAHQLAMFVVYDSPLCCICDDPDNYRNQPGVEFLRLVPTTWDETHILAGEVGVNIVSARRSGNDWYLGAMAGSTAQQLQIPLSFLKQGEYEATIDADAPDADQNPTHLDRTVMHVTAKSSLKLKLAAAGGTAIYFKRLFGTARPAPYRDPTEPFKDVPEH